MQVKSIAECSKRAFCNTFDLHKLPFVFGPLFCLILSGRLRHALLYVKRCYFSNMVYNTLLILFQNFLPPPHFRRWMQKFMKRWHKHNTSGKDTENETGNESERSGEWTDHEQPGTSSGEEHIQTDEDNAVHMMHLCSKYKARFFLLVDLQTLLL